MNSTPIRTQDIMSCLPLVASVLGAKYGVRVFIGGKSAYTNGNEIHLPSLPLDCDAEMLMLAKAFLDHEAAHIRATDFAAFTAAKLTPTETTLFNVLEDWRVEHCLAAIFPGCRYHFDWLIAHEFGGDYKPTVAKEYSHILNAILLTVRAWDVQAVQAGRDVCLSLVEQYFPDLWTPLAALLERVKTDCHSTADALEFAREISRLLQAYTQNKQQNKKNTPDETNNPQDRNDNSQPETSDLEKSTQSTDKIDNDSVHGTSSIQPTQNMEQHLCADTEASASVQELLVADASELPKNIGELLAEILQNNAAPGVGEYDMLGVAHEGTADLYQISDDVLQSIRQASTSLRTRFQSLLQSVSLQRCKNGYSGRLDTKSLYKIMLHDSCVFMRHNPKQTINTAIHILLDRSDSMCERIEFAASVCYAVTSALAGVHGINAAVTAFPADPVEYTYNNKDINVAPVIRHGERIHSKFGMHTSGSTPMAEALWWTMHQMLLLNESRKIIMLITDGDPDDVLATQQAIATAKKFGFELYGIGIDHRRIHTLLPDSSKVITTLPELAPAMFELLHKAFLPTQK